MSGHDIPSETKVLVVDDLNAARRVLTRMLGLLGLKNVEAAANYDEAISIIEKNEVEVIISDLHLGSHKATDLLDYVREQKSKKIKFMIVTSDMDKESFKNAIKQGVTSYMLKPFNKETLVKQLSGLMTPATAQETVSSTE